MQAGSTVDFTRANILSRLEVDAVRRLDGGVFIKEVVGPKEKAHPVAHCHGVGDVLRMRHVQEADRDPGHKILGYGEGRGEGQKTSKQTNTHTPDGYM